MPISEISKIVLKETDILLIKTSNETVKNEDTEYAQAISNLMRYAGFKGGIIIKPAKYDFEIITKEAVTKC